MKLCYTFIWLLQAIATEKPNILVILLDDLGWSDVGWNNHFVKSTPFLDEMARNGTILV